MKMSTVMIETEFETKKLVSYSDSTAIHNYGIKGISIVYKDELDDLISEGLCGNGYVSLSCYGHRIYGAVYETTDSYEFDDDTAYDVGSVINKAIAKLALKHGGYDAIKAD